MELTEREQRIRNVKDTKNLTDFELSEKIRIVDKEISHMDRDLIKLTREIYELHKQKDKRIEYVSKLKKDLRLKKEKHYYTDEDFD